MRHLDNIEEYLVAALLAAMVVLNFGNVLSRYVLPTSWSFTAELMLIFFVWVVLLASAVAYKRAEHLGLPLIIDMVPRRWQVLLLLISGVVSVLLIIALVVSGFILMSTQVQFEQVTPVLSLPQWVAGASIPIGGIFLLFRIVQSTVREVALRTRVEEGSF